VEEPFTASISDIERVHVAPNEEPPEGGSRRFEISATYAARDRNMASASPAIATVRVTDRFAVETQLMHVPMISMRPAPQDAAIIRLR
jgi:hypothetical protein